MNAFLAALPGLVAVQYFVLGFYIVPRLGQLVDEPGPLIRLGQFGATAFFAGCATTHVSIAGHAAVGEYDFGSTGHMLAEHVVPHIAQIIGGLLFILVVHFRLDVRISPKGYAAMERERMDLLERLRELATHDELTGVLNRRALDQELENHHKFVKRHGGTGAMLYLDLDNFKEINDVHGHRAGDELLVRAADALRDSVRSTDVVARMGGDEFCVLLRDAGPVEAAGTAERIVREIGRIDDPQPVSTSVGVAVWPTGGNRVLEAADKAMYEAKRLGGNRYRVAEANGDRA